MIARPSRRGVLQAGLAACAVGAAGVGVASGAVPVPGGVRSVLSGTPDPTAGIPAAAEGEVRLEVRDSDARSRRVGFFTAVPAGSGSGAGLPVCLVLHGASATTADFGRTFWRGDGDGDDPQRMLRDEVPAWCAERDYDISRIGAYGWSMGGHGVLTLGQSKAGFRALQVVAALSPAISAGDEVFADVARLAGVTVGLWCGLSDSLLPAAQRLAAAMQPAPQVATWSPGGHTRAYWNQVTPAAFGQIGRELAKGAKPGPGTG